MSDRSAPLPPIVDHAGPLLTSYDALFCDVWGVVHDGVRAYRDACAALERFRAERGPVILVSNAPVPEHRVAAMLEMRRVPRETYDGIVSSGRIALDRIAAAGYRRVYCIGPRDRDQAFFAATPAVSVPLAEAEAIVCTGLDDDRAETAETYRPVLEAALSRNLPFVCANPDLTVDVGGTLYLCAGAIADLYEHLGGEVYWAGKPHRIAYEAARLLAEKAAGRPLARILVIGDSVRTDLTGAARAGHDALFIAGGIHRDEITADGVIVSDALAPLLGAGRAPAIAAMVHLRW